MLFFFQIRIFFVKKSSGVNRFKNFLKDLSHLFRECHINFFLNKGWENSRGIKQYQVASSKYQEIPAAAYPP